MMEWHANPPVHQGELQQAVLRGTRYTVSRWNEYGLSSVYRRGQQVGNDFSSWEEAKVAAERFWMTYCPAEIEDESGWHCCNQTTGHHPKTEHKTYDGQVRWVTE